MEFLGKEMNSSHSKIEDEFEQVMGEVEATEFKSYTSHGQAGGLEKYCHSYLLREMFKLRIQL